MTFVAKSRILPRVLWRPAMLFFAVSQMVLAFAPIMEGRLGANAGAHVESAGTGLHHAHNDADCSACVARQLLASSEIAERQGVSLDGTLRHAVPARVDFGRAASLSDARPRAPPSLSV